MLFAKSAYHPRPAHQPKPFHKAQRPAAPVVLTDDIIKAMFQNATIILNDGVVPVAGKLIGWRRHAATGLLNGIVVNELTGNRFLYGPDLAKAGQTLKQVGTLKA